MFVRLFVDENLDRIVPISRQPKDKIQAIIDSCARQFPEFGERARKRIRTYLKSCRRTRRHKVAAVSPAARDQGQSGTESNGMTVDKGAALGLTPTPVTASTPASYHMTSAMAEQILATACDNEYQNAKRMRLGLQPVSVSVSDEPSDEECEPAPTTPFSTGGSSGAAVQVLKTNTSHTSSSSLLAALCQQQKNKLESRF